MAWETRGNARYYYRGERRGGRVVRTYLGRGSRAKQAAAEDAKARAAKHADRDAARALEAEREPLHRATVAMDGQVDLLVEAVLKAAGCHKHHGGWRRGRHHPSAPRGGTSSV